jgi:DNA (cytosine-5)-methyltransferase 1
MSAASPAAAFAAALTRCREAVETHNTNLPHALHDTADISQVDPRRYPRTDILWASPECTNHSQARGARRAPVQPDLFGDTLPTEAEQRSRATMWDVVRFSEHHRYRAVLVENVVDAYHWPPFQAWLLAMDSLGYRHQIVWINSMHAQAAGLPAPQSRDRMYVVFWRSGDHAPDLRRWTSPRAWCPRCDHEVRAVQTFKRVDRPAWGRYGPRNQYVYRCPAERCHEIVEPGILPAAAAIDWSLRGERIGDRAKPLAEKTRARIRAGLIKFGRPVTLEAAGNTFERPGYHRVWPVDDPLTTQTTTMTKGLAMLVPVEGRVGTAARSAAEPLRAQTARNETALVVPVRTHGTATLASEPVTTIVAGSLRLALVLPLRNNNTAKGIDEPFDTFAAGGQHNAMVMRNNGSRGDGGEHCTDIDDVLRTLTTAGHQSLVHWDSPYSYDTGALGSLASPPPTRATVEGDALLGTELDVDDCWFRMLQPDEIKRGMAFDDGYLLLGNRREQVRLAGNAVTPPAARDLGAAVVEALIGRGAA